MYVKVVPLHDDIADGWIDGAERVVEQVDVSVGVERTRQTDARLLAARQRHAALAHQRAVTVRQLYHILVQQRPEAMHSHNHVYMTAKSKGGIRDSSTESTI